MMPEFQALVDALKHLPSLGPRSAERIALSLLTSDPDSLLALARSLTLAHDSLGPCPSCFNLSQKGHLCSICSNPSRDTSSLCIVETVPDLFSIERSGSFPGLYHVLGGKLSPIRGILPDSLNIAPLSERLQSGQFSEVILALGNDMEAEATCHYLTSEILADFDLSISRLGFGLPSGGGVNIADSATLQSAFSNRKSF